MKLVGYKKAKDFVAPDTGVVFEGWNLYFTFPLEAKPDQAGFGCMICNFVKDSVFKRFLNECEQWSVKPVGAEVECYYSRYSKPGKPKIDLIQLSDETKDGISDSVD